jgi:transcription termination factor Rho
MSGGLPLERSVLERKERGELHLIAESLGLNPGARLRKAELIDKILDATGSSAAGSRPVLELVGGATEGRGPSSPAPSVEARSASSGAGTAPEHDAGAHDPAGSNGAGTPPRSEAASAPVAPPRSDVAGPPPATPRSEVVSAPPAAAPRTRPEGGGRSGGGHQTPSEPRGGGDRTWSAGPPQRGNTVGEEGGRRRRRRTRDRPGSEREFAAAERASSSGEQPDTGEPTPVKGLLDLREEGFGFIRTSGFIAGPEDVYVATVQVKRFGLRKGDVIEGVSRPAGPGEKFPALLRIESVSGLDVEEARQRRRFEDLTPLFPDTRLQMEHPNDSTNVTARIIDLMCPIGKGQRGLIVSPPKAGKTTVIKQIARSIERNNPEVHLMVLLVDERPEEVTDMRRTVKGEVVASTFDRPADEHTQVAELALERAKRLVEANRDVVIILDGITRLTRAYNLSAPSSGRLTSGGIDQAAIYPPKKFFGAARNAEEGGSLTILATALVETGSKADDVIFEELKGTGNMELRLDRRLAERRLYPAIDVNASSTRHEELLFDRGQLQLVWRLRRVLNGLADDGTPWKALELLMDKIKTTRTNAEFLAEVAKTQLPV